MRRLQLNVGIGLTTVVVAMALLSFVWTPFDPLQVVPADKLAAPGWPHILGADGFGIDILSQLLVGARSALLVGIVSVALAAVVGVPLGIIAGQNGGWLDELISRLADIVFAFPALLLAILLAAVYGGSTWTAMVAIGVATIPAFARTSRAATLEVMAADYILAARACGTRGAKLALKHIWPNIAALVWIQASVGFAMAILAEAALAYLGLGTPRGTPTWGAMLRDAQGYIFTDPLQALWPGLAIAIAVLGFNLLGDGLRDVLDPKLREAR
ncbi:MAG: ABC transporter permease [Propionibacteriaceae bacterium]|jgi:peptide/nickel transport system permease protein|nr:ABC transporter permease [Propionibacteriaceae bacterium]